MGNFGGLILILVAVAAVLVVRQYLRSRKERQVRLAPMPPRKVVEVKLPRDVKDANARMKRFYGRVAATTSSDPQAREQGIGQIDLIYLAERPPNHLTPQLRFFIVTDEKTMPTVKRALKTAFEQQAEVFNLELDPLGDVFEQMRERALKESQGSDYDPDAEDLDDGEPGEAKERRGGMAAA